MGARARGSPSSSLCHSRIILLAVYWITPIPPIVSLNVNQVSRPLFSSDSRLLLTNFPHLGPAQCWDVEKQVDHAFNPAEWRDLKVEARGDLNLEGPFVSSKGLIALNLDGCVKLVNVVTGETTAILGPEAEGTERTYLLSPDGAYLAIQLRFDDVPISDDITFWNIERKKRGGR